MKRWTVRSEIGPDGPEYYVIDTKDGTRIHGGFDCERAAQIFADFKNAREEHGKTERFNEGHKAD